jgi:hypothetical protein
MASRLLAVTFDADDPRRLAQFWAAVLSRDVVETTAGATLPGDDTQVGLRFAPSPGADAEPRRMHLHLTSSDQADQQETVAKALELGGRHLDVGQLPEEQHVVLADPGGNPFCVIPPGNAFLAGCGFLGEVACEGAREVGLFWSEALGWPLVWDQEGETAIQSSLGGTKIAWGGPPVAAPAIPARQRFDLGPESDARREIERLVSLGATRVDDDTLVDPGGNEFRLHVSQD